MKKQVTIISVAFLLFFTLIFVFSKDFKNNKKMTERVLIITDNCTVMAKGAGVEVESGNKKITDFLKTKWGSGCYVANMSIDNGGKITIVRKIGNNFVRNVFIVPNLKSYPSRNSERRFKFFVTKENKPQLKLLYCTNYFKENECEDLLILKPI